MVIYLLRKNQIISLKLPTIIQGNYWLSYKDDEGSEVNLVNIEASNDQWIVKSNEEASVYLDGVFKQNIAFFLHIGKTFRLTSPQELL